ncbi:MAG: O-antigen ligase family protein [Solirubrobacteraceae bacterium]
MVINRWQALAMIGAVVGLAGGILAEKRPSTAIELCVILGAIVALAMLGDRAFPWAIVIVAVAPWYPFTAHSAAPSGINQKAICIVIASAVLGPWLWSLGVGGRRTRPNPRTLLLGLLYAGMALFIYMTVGGISKMVTPVIAGYLFAGVAFLCARRFVDVSSWTTPGFVGLVILLLLGAEAYAGAPTERVGYFVGYPITYGALLVGLIPIGLLFAFRRSRALAGVIVAASVAMLVFSESRSAWIATAVVLLVLMALLARGRKLRALALVVAALMIALGLVAGTGSLQKVIERRVNSKTASSESVTHRLWSVEYALTQVGANPIFGAGAPGFSAEEANNRTSIGAIDNGYLSVSVDMGLVGLCAALIPILIALAVLARCFRFGVTPPLELALALGVLGMAVVTLFYDSFYWSQIDLLFGAMGGALSLRINAIAPAPAEQPIKAVRVERTLGLLAGR